MPLPSRTPPSIEGFYTASFPTIPHRTDVATGVLGWPHYPWQPISRSGPNHIAGSLGAQGYATQLICDCPHLFNSRFQHAFDAAFQHRGQEGDKHLLQLNRPIRETVPPTKVRTKPAWRGGESHGPASLDEPLLRVRGGHLRRPHRRHRQPLAGGEPRWHGRSSCG